MPFLFLGRGVERISNTENTEETRSTRRFGRQDAGVEILRRAKGARLRMTRRWWRVGRCRARQGDSVRRQGRRSSRRSGPPRKGIRGPKHGPQKAAATQARRKQKGRGSMGRK